jgi:hypothetical protein
MHPSLDDELAALKHQRGNALPSNIERKESEPGSLTSLITRRYPLSSHEESQSPITFSIRWGDSSILKDNDQKRARCIGCATDFILS